MSSSASGSPLPVICSPQGTALRLKKLFPKSICGDKFGTSEESQKVSMLGMLYQSRLQVGIVEDPLISLHTAEEQFKRSQASADDASDLSKRTNWNDRLNKDDELDDDEISTKLDPKQRLAMTIKNWSFKPENDEHILKEGAVEALIALSVIEDLKIKKSCSISFYNLSSREKNRSRLLALGTVAGIVSVVNIGRCNWEVAKYCAMALCNLSMENGGEARMAKEGITVAITCLISVKHNILLEICAQTLFNMSCVVEEYPGSSIRQTSL